MVLIFFVKLYDLILLCLVGIGMDVLVRVKMGIGKIVVFLVNVLISL